MWSARSIVIVAPHILCPPLPSPISFFACLVYNMNGTKCRIQFYGWMTVACVMVHLSVCRWYVLYSIFQKRYNRILTTAIKRKRTLATDKFYATETDEKSMGNLKRIAYKTQSDGNHNIFITMRRPSPIPRPSSSSMPSRRSFRSVGACTVQRMAIQIEFIRS